MTEPRTPEDQARQQARTSRRYRRALKRGELTRAAACESCGEFCRTDGHHWHGYEDEYAFDVQWLCRPCHNREHSGRLGGLAGGRAFVAKVPLEQRLEIARQGGLARAKSQTAEQRSALSRTGGVGFVAKSTSAERAARGRKGGQVTMARMTPEERSALGRKAALARWARRSQA